MPLDLAWNRTLKHRRGAATRLDGIDLYYDFDWSDYFSDGRAQFQNGQCLAQNVSAQCPDGKTPALLLTDQDDQDEGYLDTPLHRVFVVNLPRYLSTYADPSLAYQAHRLGDGIARIGPLNSEAADRARAGAAVLEAELDLDQIAAWAAHNPERKQQLQELAGEGNGDPPGIAEVLTALEGLADGLDADAVAVIGRLFGADGDRERRMELIRAITDDPSGRYLTGEVLVERIPQRIADARAAMSAYQELLDDTETNETQMQAFIEENLWLLGLDYAAMRPRQALPMAEMDFLLERFDGVHDLLELKSPQDEIVKVRDPGGEAVPPPSSYELSPSLAKALAQVHIYRDRMTRHAPVAEDLYGLSQTRDPHLTIVIGRADPLSEQSKRVLGELNKSLHRVEVVPYDALGERANRVLDNVEKYLLAAEEEQDGAQAA